MKLPRVNVLGVGINAINLQQAVDEIIRWVAEGDRQYVTVCGVHGVMACQNAPRHRQILNDSGLSTPDGMPLVWLSRHYGYDGADRVYGPDLMLALCDQGQALGVRHFFYGGTPEVAERLVTNLQRQFPALAVAGVFSPPFRPVDAQEDPEVIQRINESRPDIVWVGLGVPKQDYWVARHRPVLTAAALIAVGAAFDFHAGLLPQAPRWMQRSGLEWLFRLAHEPRRLGPRYLINNPRFLFKIAMQLARRPSPPLS